MFNFLKSRCLKALTVILVVVNIYWENAVNMFFVKHCKLLQLLKFCKQIIW